MIDEEILVFVQNLKAQYIDFPNWTKTAQPTTYIVKHQGWYEGRIDAHKAASLSVLPTPTM